MAAYLEIPQFLSDGKSLKVEVESIQFGIGRGGGNHVPNETNSESTAPSITDLSITRIQDKYSPLFYQEALTGSARPMIVYLVDSSKSTIKTYLTIKLENAMISGYSFSGGGDRPSEMISINFTKVEYKYDPV